MEENRKRSIRMRFYVTPEERTIIEEKMALLGTANLSAYLRKMALDGYALNLDLPELREMVSLLRRSSNNLNQLTRRVHETGRFYDADLESLRQDYDRIWDATGVIVSKLAGLKWSGGGGWFSHCRPALFISLPIMRSLVE